MRKLVLAVALAAALLLAGCTGGVGTPGTDSSATPTVPSTPTEKPTQSANGNPTPTLTPTSTVEPGSVVEYAELNDQQQDAFRDAISGEVSFVPNTSYVNDSAGYAFEHVDPFHGHEYVRYDSDLYRISTHPGELYASYQIRASVGSPEEDATVVALTDLPASVREEVRTALTEGEYYAPMGKWDTLPESLQDTDYVRYDNETYEMGYVVGDAWATVLTVERVD